MLAQQGHQLGTSTQPRAAGTPYGDSAGVGTLLPSARSCNPGVPGTGAMSRECGTQGPTRKAATCSHREWPTVKSTVILRCLLKAPNLALDARPLAFGGWIVVTSPSWANSAPWPGCRKGCRSHSPALWLKAMLGFAQFNRPFAKYSCLNFSSSSSAAGRLREGRCGELRAFLLPPRSHK